MKAFLYSLLGIIVVVMIGSIICKMFGWEWGVVSYLTGWIAKDVSDSIEKYVTEKEKNDGQE